MRRIVAIALSLTLLATACSDDDSDEAAAIDAEAAAGLEAVDLGSDVLARVGNATLTETEALDFVADDGTGVIDRTALAGNIQLWAILEAVAQELTKRGGAITPADTALSGSAALEARQNSLVADLQAFAESETATAAIDAEPPIVFCSSHILVETEAEALDLLAQLEDGADFAQLATEFSIDGSAAGGGDLGCIAQGQTVPAFEEPIFASGQPGLLGPIQTDFGFHLVDVRSIGPATAEFHPDDLEALAAIPDPAATQQQEVVGNYVNELIGVAFQTIEVDDSLGVFDPLAGGIVPVGG